MLLALFLTSLVSTPALAAKNKKPAGLRLKVGAPLVGLDTSTLQSGNLDPVVEKTTSLDLLSGPMRLEATWRLKGIKGLEVGAIAGFQSSTTTLDDEPSSSAIGYQFFGTAAYNFKISKPLRGFVQPIVGLAEEKTANDAAETDTIVTSFVWGADAGLRIKLTERVRVEPAVEYLRSSGPVQVNGVALDDTTQQDQWLALRWGLSVML